MDRQQLRLAFRAWLTGVLASVVLMWIVFHTTFRIQFWDSMAQRPLSEAERAGIERCEPPAWWTWLKLVQSDADVPCGEVWFVEQLAEKVGDRDRARWLQLRAELPDLPVRTRMRISLALLAGGNPAREEPAWIVDELPDEARAEWVSAAARSAIFAAQLGPRTSGLGALVRARFGGVSELDVLPTLYWLAHVDDPRAELAAAETAAALAQVPLDLAARVRTRLAARMPVGRPDARFAHRVLAHPECGERCGALYVEILDLVLTDAALQEGAPAPVDPPEPRMIAELLTAADASVAERRAATRGVQIAAEWVRAAPDPAARLRSLVAQVPDDRWSVARVAWDGGGTPLLSALTLAAIAEEAGVRAEVRVDDAGAVWFRIGGVDVARSCGEIGARPEGSPWPMAGLVAGALVERAESLLEQDPGAARRLAIAAQRTDPLVGGPLAVRLAGTAPPELEIGRRIGTSLLGPMSLPSGADAGRKGLGERGPKRCVALGLPEPGGAGPTPPPRE